MRVLLVDTGLSEALALRIADEGNQVFYYSTWEAAEPKEADTLYGVGVLDEHPNIQRVQNWAAHVDDAELVVFTDVGFGEAVDDLLSKGKPVFGVSSEGQKLETERTFAKELFPHLRYPDSSVFESPEEALSFVREKIDEWGGVVLKLSGFIRGTHIVNSYTQAEHILSVISQYSSEECRIVVSRFIHGVEVAVGTFVGRDTPLLDYGWNMNFEEKYKMAGGLGVLTGEMGTTLFWAGPMDTVDLVSSTLLPMSSWLRSHYGVHYIDVNLIVEYETGQPYVLEFTTRFGYPHILISLPLLQSDFTELLWSAATGQPHSPAWDNRIAVGIGVNTPGYPFDCVLEQYAHFPVELYGVSEEEKKYFVPAGVYKKEGDPENLYRVVPSHGRTFVVVGVGDTLAEAQLRAVSRADKVKLYGSTWRIDIGDRLYAEAVHLLQHRYLSSHRYKMIVEYGVGG